MTEYNLGYFGRALKDAEAAYRLDPLPGLLFNLGQCHRALKHWERAEVFYRSYLRNNPGAKNKELVHELIDKVVAEEKAAEQEKAAAEQKAAAAAAAAAVPAPAPVPSVVLVEAPAAAINPSPAPPVAEATVTSSRGSRVWPWVLGGGALLFAGAAAWGWYEAADYPSVKASTVGHPVPLSTATGQQTLATAGFATAIAGGAIAIGLATGAVLTW
jgi:tetratricopeptide (TPR) repeat protein